MAKVGASGHIWASIAILARGSEFIFWTGPCIDLKPIGYATRIMAASGDVGVEWIRQWARREACAMEVTLLLGGIYKDYTKAKLVELMDCLNFDDAYDFLFLPRSSSCARCLGYAFVNFRRAEDARAFRELVRVTAGFSATFADRQGLEEMVASWLSAHNLDRACADWESLPVVRSSRAAPGVSSDVGVAILMRARAPREGHLPLPSRLSSSLSSRGRGFETSSNVVEATCPSGQEVARAGLSHGVFARPHRAGGVLHLTQVSCRAAWLVLIHQRLNIELLCPGG